MLVVIDEARAEHDLVGSAISCPSCSSGRLRPWGYARGRLLRGLGGVRRRVRPRRARCRDCGSTHVLLPADVPVRRADTLEVVITGLLAHHHGAGHRRIAADLGVPPDTVRAWLRRVRARAEWLRVDATRCAHAFDPELGPLEPTGTPLGDALEALGAAAARMRLRLSRYADTSQLIGAIAGGRLLAPLPSPRHDR